MSRVIKAGLIQAHNVGDAGAPIDEIKKANIDHQMKLVEEAAAAAESLEEQARSLAESVAVFRLPGGVIGLLEGMRSGSKIVPKPLLTAAAPKKNSTSPRLALMAPDEDEWAEF